MDIASADPLQGAIDARLAENRSRRLGSVDRAPLRWLAIVPEWSDALAMSCGFPSTERLEQDIDRAVAAGLCERRADFDARGDEVVRFWMPRKERERLLPELVREGGDALRDEAGDIAERIERAAAAGADVQPGVARWAELANEEVHAGAMTGQALSAAVDDCLARSSTAEALEWIYAGEALAPLLGAELASALERAKRRVNLHYRMRRDDRALRRFLERHEQIDALDALLAGQGPEAPWALHFVGMGGVGKTMLMRHLTGPYAEKRDLAVARVDFDHVDPRYPSAQPGRLLAELADGLTLYAGGSLQDSLLQSLLEAIAEADRVAATLLATGDPLAAVRTRAVAQAVAAFAAFADSLGRPVVLVLDTCEELAKLHPVADSVPSIDATFEMLEPLARGARAVRVVFAGRRMLTRKARNWEVDPDLPQPAVMSLRDQPGLLVHEVRGFTPGEVDKYLRGIRDLEVEPRLLDAVLGSSQETGRVSGFPPDPGERRYNPFDIALYADWIAEEGDLDPERIAAGDVDPYITMRIVERLRKEPAVVAALPAAVLLGRFDAQTIAPALPDEPDAARRTLLALSEQEWVDTSPGAHDGDMVLAIESTLLPRLRRYYEHPDRGHLLVAARRALADALQEALGHPPTVLTGEQVDAALRILPVEVAAPAFDRLAARVAAEQAWWWAEPVCSGLLALDREDPLPPGVMGSVRALWIAALRHRRATAPIASGWAAVSDEAKAHPDAAAGEVLAARARLGRLVAAVEAGESFDVALIETAVAGLDDDQHRAVAPAIVAAIEARLDAEELRPPRVGERSPVDPARLRDRHAGLRTTAKVVSSVVTGPDPVLALWAQALAARALVLLGADGDGAWRSMRPLLEDSALDGPPPGQRYADWVVPDSIRGRLLLDALRIAILADEADPALLARCDAAVVEGLATIDEERLLSLVLQARLASSTYSDDDRQRLMALERRLGAPRPTAAAHRAAPPLFASVADLLFAAGEPETALSLLMSRERETAARREDQAAEGDAAVHVLRAVRRLRLDQRLGQLRQLTVADDPVVRFEAQATRVLVGEEDPGWWRRNPAAAVWSAQDLLDASGEDVLLLVEGTDDSLATDLIAAAFDRAEVDRVLERVDGRPLVPFGGDAPARERLARLQRTPPMEPADPFCLRRGRLELRAWALGFGRVPPAFEGQEALGGRLAFEEGELLALRVPDLAEALLGLAERNLDAAGDRAGACWAALRGAIALVHAGQATEARRRLERVGIRYGEARAADPTLPPWESLAGAAGDHPQRGWLRRLDAFRAWCEADGDAAPAAQAAAELRLRPARVATGSPPSPMAARARATAGRLVPAAVAVGAAVVTALVALWAELEAGIAVLSGAFVLLAMLFITRFAGPLMLRLLAPLVAADIVIESVGETASSGSSASPTGGVASVTVSAGGRSRAFAWLVDLAGARPSSTTLGAWEDPFAEELPPEVLNAVRPNLPLRMPLRLLVAPELAAGPWEARIAAPAAADPVWTPARGPQIWRRGPTGRRTRVWAPEQIATIICADEWQSFFQRAWLGAWLGTTTLETEPRVEPGSRVLVLLGSAVASGGGWRVRIASRSPSGPATKGSAKARDAGEGPLLDPELARESSPVVVVMAPPAGESPVLDRRAADGLRGFADEAFAAGAYAVFTIPPLPPQLVERLLETIASAAYGWRTRPATRALARLVMTLREMVHGYEDGPAADERARRERMQVALDICLYAGAEID